MKKFETPVVNVTKFEIADVLTTSTGTSVGGNGNFGGADED